MDGRLYSGQHFNRLGQYASSPDNSTHCYAELAISSLAVAETISSTHCYPRRVGQAEWAWVTWLNTEGCKWHSLLGLVSDIYIYIYIVNANSVVVIVQWFCRRSTEALILLSLCIFFSSQSHVHVSNALNYLNNVFLVRHFFAKPYYVAEFFSAFFNLYILMCQRSAFDRSQVWLPGDLSTARYYWCTFVRCLDNVAKKRAVIM